MTEIQVSHEKLLEGVRKTYSAELEELRYRNVALTIALQDAREAMLMQQQRIGEERQENASLRSELVAARSNPAGGEVDNRTPNTDNEQC